MVAGSSDGSVVDPPNNDKNLGTGRTYDEGTAAFVVCRGRNREMAEKYQPQARGRVGLIKVPSERRFAYT